MTLAHRLVGNGPRRVIALHGWFGDETGFAPMERALDTDAFTWCFVAYRGCGGSKGLTGTYTMEEIAGDVLAVADQLGWDTFSLVGHSMGGMAIQKVLALAPGRVEKLVGVTPVPATGVPFDDGGWAFFSSAAASFDARREIINITTGSRLTTAWLQRMAQHSWESATQEAFAGYLVAWAKTNFVEQIQGNPVPVKVIVGEHDPALSADVMKQTWLQHYPNISMDVMANAGHYPMEETPVALATAIEGFLKG